MTKRRHGATRRPPPAPHLVEVTIESVGGRGDGIARHRDKPLYVPLAAPGDRVLARIEAAKGDGFAASLIEVLEPGPCRVAPPCPHYGVCGGCAVQHLDRDTDAAWKRGVVATALSRQGLDPAVVGPALRLPPGQRRRAAFAFARTQRGVVLGFNARASHRVVDIDACPAADPALGAALPALRRLLAEVVPAGTGGDVIVTLAGGGLDVVVEAEARLDLFDREAIAAFAADEDLTRLCWRRPGGGLEPLAQRRPAVVVLGGVPVEVPPGAFLQPSAAGEQALAGLVCAAVAGAPRVADLFAGCGTLSFPLARRSRVHAVEGDGAALSALKSAADRAGVNLTTETRDLARRPLLADELTHFDAVVFDPPRAGAAEQAAVLAQAGPGVVVGVSCHPASFARDARLLVDGGYRLTAVTPVDQFPWAAHVEAVGVFAR